MTKGGSVSAQPSLYHKDQKHQVYSVQGNQHHSSDDEDSKVYDENVVIYSNNDP